MNDYYLGSPGAYIVEGSGPGEQHSALESPPGAPRRGRGALPTRAPTQFASLPEATPGGVAAADDMFDGLFDKGISRMQSRARASREKDQTPVSRVRTNVDYSVAGLTAADGRRHEDFVYSNPVGLQSGGREAGADGGVPGDTPPYDPSLPPTEDGPPRAFVFQEYPPASLLAPGRPPS